MRVERFVEIDAPVEHVFDAFGDFENVPRWMRNVRGVRRTGRRTTRWTADAPRDAPFEWDVEITHYEPDRRIVWRSVGGDVDTDGEMILQETQHGTALMRLVISYYPTGGQNGPAVARFFGRDADHQLEEDLERLKRDLERRAGARRRPPRQRDDEHARERVSYHATRPDDERDARRARPRDAREPRRPARSDQFDRDFNPQLRMSDAREGQRRDVRFREDHSSADRRARDDERERRFDEALREARRSQLESMRRYDEERERARRRRADDDQEHHRREDERERRPRYALTPRERERETPERSFDREYSGEAMRRGVDRLLDDAPSSRWRRRD